MLPDGYDVAHFLQLQMVDLGVGTAHLGLGTALSSVTAAFAWSRETVPSARGMVYGIGARHPLMTRNLGPS